MIRNQELRDQFEKLAMENQWTKIVNLLRQQSIPTIIFYSLYLGQWLDLCDSCTLMNELEDQEDDSRFRIRSDD